MFSDTHNTIGYEARVDWPLTGLIELMVDGWRCGEYSVEDPMRQQDTSVTDDESNLIIFGETCNNNLFPWVSIRGFTVSWWWSSLVFGWWGDDDQERDSAEIEEYNSKIHQHGHHRDGWGEGKAVQGCVISSLLLLWFMKMYVGREHRNK